MEDGRAISFTPRAFVHDFAFPPKSGFGNHDVAGRPSGELADIPVFYELAYDRKSCLSLGSRTSGDRAAPCVAKTEQRTNGSRVQEGMWISIPSRSALVTRMFVAANFRSTLVRPSGSGGANSQTSTA